MSVKADAEEGRNVLRAGEEISAGATIAKRGEVLLPGRLGLAAAAGITRARVYRRPKAAVVGLARTMQETVYPVALQDMFVQKNGKPLTWVT